MKREDMLAQLIAQAREEGSDLVTLRGLVEESAELGGERVLARLGLNDENAQDDLDKLRELLRSWRAAKANAWKAAVEWLVRGVMAVLLIGITVRLNLTDFLG